jgi:hypothetical protein
VLPLNSHYLRVELVEAGDGFEPVDDGAVLVNWVDDGVADGQVVGGDVVDGVAGGGFGGAGEILGGPSRQVELVGGGDRRAGGDVGDGELGGPPNCLRPPPLRVGTPSRWQLEPPMRLWQDC